MCIFAWIHALFTLILLTHKIMIMFCICVGVPLALCGRLVLFVIIQKNGKQENWLDAFSGEAEVSTITFINNRLL